MDSTKLLDFIGLGKQSHYVLTMSGVFTNGHTVTITGPGGAIVFTFVTALSSGPAVPGEIKIGTAAANLGHLLAVFNNPALATNVDYTALSAADQAKLTALKLQASADATTLTLNNPYFFEITVAETLTNGAWSGYSYSAPMAVNSKANISLQLIAMEITSGNGVLTLEVSNNGKDWSAYNRLISNVTNTNAQGDTKVASLTQSSNGSSTVMIPSNDTFAFMRVKVVTTTDGKYCVCACNR